MLDKNDNDDDNHAVTYDDFQRTNDFGKCDFLTF